MKKIFSLISMTPLLVSVGCNSETLTGFSAQQKMGNDKNYSVEGKTNSSGEITDINFGIKYDNGISKRTSAYYMNVCEFTLKAHLDDKSLLSVRVSGSHSKWDNSSKAQYSGTATLLLPKNDHSSVIDMTINDLINYNVSGSGVQNTVTEKAFNNAWGAPWSVEDAVVAFQPCAESAANISNYDASTTKLGDVMEGVGIIKNDLIDTEGELAQFSTKGDFNSGTLDEQYNALEDHIVKNKMTFEKTFELLKSGNIIKDGGNGAWDRETVSGATIAFISDQYRILYKAWKNEKLNSWVASDKTVGEVRTITVRGFGYNQLELGFIFNTKTGKITGVDVSKHEETSTIGGKLLEDQEFIKWLINNQDDLSGKFTGGTIAGATITYNGVIELMKFAIETYKN